MHESKRAIAAEDLQRIHTIDSPRISPDGRYAAFVRATPDPMERGYKRNIWLHDMDQGAIRQLTRGDKDSQPAWSPDGKSLAFVSARGEKPQIYLLPVFGIGGEARQVTSSPNGAHSPSWSPDSGRIAFLAPMREDERQSEADGDAAPEPENKLESKHRKERRAEDEKKRWDPRPMWRIPYRQGTAYVDERYDQIYIIDAVEGAEPKRLTNISADYSPPRFSDDGDSLFSARASMPEADEPWRAQNVFRIDVETGAENALTDGANSLYDPLPSPDGEWLALGMLPVDATDIPMRLLLLSLHDGEMRAINETLDREALSWRWSSDGKLAFTLESEGTTTPWLYNPGSDSSRQLHAGRYDIEDFDIADSGKLAMSVSTPRNPCELYTLLGGDFREATDFNHEWLDEVIVQEVRELRYMTPQGNAQGWYMLPLDYQPGDKAPLALNIHGGPHATWGFRHQEYVARMAISRGAGVCGLLLQSTRQRRLWRNLHAPTSRGLGTRRHGRHHGGRRRFAANGLCRWRTYGDHRRLLWRLHDGLDHRSMPALQGGGFPTRRLQPQQLLWHIRRAPADFQRI